MLGAPKYPLRLLTPHIAKETGNKSERTGVIPFIQEVKTEEAPREGIVHYN